MLPFLDKAYGTSWSGSQSRLWEHGKNAGWGYVTLAAEPTTTSSIKPSKGFGTGGKKK